MLLSVVVCTHNKKNIQNLREAVDSLLNQSYREMEIVVVVDGNRELYEEVLNIYQSCKNLKVVDTGKNIGLSGARNAGAKVAEGDVVAFFDDDAFADKGWGENIMHIYQTSDAISVGGEILPVWLSGKPDYFPEELGWLVGITHEGFAGDEVTEVRNSFGPNMSFRIEVFDKVGYFDQRLGFGHRGTSYMQGEEADFTLRMRREMGRGVIYNPDAVVYHKIPQWKTKPAVLLRRSFYQGYSKALLQRFNPASGPLATEGSYLSEVLFRFIPRRMRRVLSKNAISEMKKLSLLIASVIGVGLGFGYGYLRR